MKLTIVYTLLYFASVWAGRTSSKPNIISIPDFLGQNFQMHPKIVGGDEAVPHSIPYQIALIIGVEDYYILCGGSLISQNYVLTAAHCFDKAQYAFVVLGAHDLSKEYEPKRIWFYVDVSQIVVHKKWNISTLMNDIAVVHLYEKITLSDAINIVGLPKRSEVEESFAGKTAKASGWGEYFNTENIKFSPSPVLRYIDVPVITNSLCNTSFEGIIQKNHICTSNKGGKSICSGDDGGPLVVGNTQIGIASFIWGNGCTLERPAGFTRVSEYLDWIEENTDVKIQNKKI